MNIIFLRLKLQICLIIVVVLSGGLFTSYCFAQEEKFFEIKAKKFSYTPHKIIVNKGDKVTLRLVSEDVTHGLYIDGYGLETKAHPGQDGSITFIAGKTGKFTFRCSVTCGEFHPYMVGNLIVGPNYRFYAYVLMILAIGVGSGVVIFRKSKE